MIRSMTGFGRASFEVDGIDFEVEARSVNHRHLDARVRLPRQLVHVESGVKTQIQARMQRGRVDLNVSRAVDSAAPTLLIDREVAAQYLEASRELSQAHGLVGDLDVATLLTLPGVTAFRERELSEEQVGSRLAGAVDEALAAVDAMRVTEGEALGRELRQRLERVEELVESLDARSELVQRAVREKLEKRTRQLAEQTGLLDEARLYQEIVIAADRLDITEELVRLRSHIEQFRSITAEAAQDVAVGRRLDFLLQELGREANTVGSKANDAPLAHDVVALKTELERIREQVQNVE
jgi:uncharacterized protein (TIGR00255 family)